MSRAAFDSEAFDRATDSILQFFTPQQAELIVNYRGEPSLRRRIEQLAHKSNEAELTEPERAEYQGYLRASKFVAILQAKVAKLLSTS